MHVVNSLPGVPPWESAPEPDTDVVVRRLLAFAVDGVLVSLVTGIVCRPLTPLHLAVGPLGSSDSVLQLLFGKPTAPFWPLVAPVVLAYFIACEALFGLTPGKALAGLRVVNRDGTRAGLGPVVVRNLLRLVEGWNTLLWLGCAVILLSPRRQRIGDHLAGTLVADARSVPASHLSRRVARQRALGCALGVPLAYLASLLLAYLNPAPVLVDRAWNWKQPAVLSSDLIAALPQTLAVSGPWDVDRPRRNGRFLSYTVRYEVVINGPRRGHTCYATARLRWANSYLWIDGWTPYDLTTRCLGSTRHTYSMSPALCRQRYVASAMSPALCRQRSHGPWSWHGPCVPSLNRNAARAAHSRCASP